MPTVCYDPETGLQLGIWRSPYAIYLSLVALTASQKIAIWNDLTIGSPVKWTLNDQPGSEAILLAVGLTANLAGAMTAAQLTDMKIRAVAAYIRCYPKYLVNPAFDPTINVPGFTP